MYIYFRTKLFPEEDTPNWIFKGIPYKELPIVNVRATHNNTILSLTDYKGNFNNSKSNKVFLYMYLRIAIIYL